jgi:hypothetical protein
MQAIMMTSLLGFSYVFSDITLFFFGVDDVYLKWFFIIFYNFLFSLEPKVKTFLSPMLDSSFRLNFYRYTGGVVVISIGFISNKFFFFILLGIYYSIFFILAEND